MPISTVSQMTWLHALATRFGSPMPQLWDTTTVPPAPMPLNIQTTRFVTGPTSETAATELSPLLLMSAVISMPMSMIERLSSMKGIVI